MTTKTKSNSKSNKQILDINVECIKDKDTLKVFRVHIKEGKFIVVDYKNRFGVNADTEIFWESGAHQLNPTSSEYKAANKAVTDYLK